MGSAIATVSVQSPEQVKNALQNITNKRTPQSVVYLQTIQHVDTSNVSAYPTHTATMRNPKMAAGRYEDGGKVGPLGPSTPSVRPCLCIFRYGERIRRRNPLNPTGDGTNEREIRCGLFQIRRKQRSLYNEYPSSDHALDGQKVPF